MPSHAAAQALRATRSTCGWWYERSSCRSGPPIGAVLPDLNGAFRVSHPTKPTVLLFSEATCSTCAELLPELARLAGEHREMIQFGVVFRGKGTAVDGPIVAAFEH